MQSTGQQETARFDTRFFPQHIALLTVAENLMPMGYWTVISKDPFQFLICMQVGNLSLTLLKKYKEAEASLTKALDIEPDHELAQAMLMEIKGYKGDK